MSETYQFALPLVQPAQAQKHVTVNEALARLDTVAQLRVVASDQTAPPLAPVDGESYRLPLAATGDWAGHDGEIAVWSNGGWVFLTPKAGWKLWDEAASITSLFDGVDWSDHADAVSVGGAASITRIIEIDHDVAAATTSVVPAIIPAQSQVIGVTGRVIDAITGTATTWRIGVAGSDNRYGSGLGLGLNGFLRGLSGTPVTYYSNTDLILTGEGGDFADGTVRLAIHVVELLPPRAV